MNLNIKISQKIKEKTPDFALGVLFFDAVIEETGELSRFIHQIELDIQQNFTGSKDLKDEIEISRRLYERFAKAKNIQSWIIQ